MVMLSGHEFAIQLTNHIQVTRQINPKKLQHEKKEFEEFRFRIFTKVTEHGPLSKEEPKIDARIGKQHAVNEPELKKENIDALDDAVKDVILGNVEASLTFFTPKRFLIDVTEQEQELSTTFFTLKKYTIEVVNTHENVQRVWCTSGMGVVDVCENFYIRKRFHIATVCEESEWEREWIGKNRQCCLL